MELTDSGKNNYKRLPKNFDRLLIYANNPNIGIGYESLYKVQVGDAFTYVYLPPLDKHVGHGGGENPYLHQDLTYTLKIAYIFWCPAWNKQIHDIQVMKAQGARILPALFNELFKFFSIEYGENKRIKTYWPERLVFLKAIKTKIQPMYTFAKDFKGQISEHGFHRMNLEDKLLFVKEHACTLAYNDYFMDDDDMKPATAYRLALRDMVMKSTPLWLAVFILNNYTELSKPHLDYKEKIGKLPNLKKKQKLNLHYEL